MLNNAFSNTTIIRSAIKSTEDNINPAVCDIAYIVSHCALKEHNIAGLHLIGRHIPAQAAQPFCPQTACVVHTAACKDIADEAGTVETGFRG